MTQVSAVREYVMGGVNHNWASRGVVTRVGGRGGKKKRKGGDSNG